MKAVLLAAGLGTRLKPLTDNMPKCLVPIHGTPLLEYWFRLLEPSPHISAIYINLHYKKEQVIDYLNSHWQQSSKIEVLHETNLQGTAGTLNALRLGREQEPVLIIHADNLSDFSLDAFIQAHHRRPKDCVMTMMLFRTDAPSSCGIVELDEQGRVIQMHEKVKSPPGNLANAAVYIMQPEVLAWASRQSVSDISSQIIPAYNGKIYSWLNTGYHRDIGNPRSYELAHEEFQP